MLALLALWLGSAHAVRLLDLQPIEQRVPVPVLELGSHPDPAEFYKRCGILFWGLVGGGLPTPRARALQPRFCSTGTTEIPYPLR